MTIGKEDRGWSEDWQVGDLAQCINDSWSRPCDEHPQLHEINRVSGVYPDEAPSGTVYRLLRFEGKDQSKGWYAPCFKKIRPDHSADEIETGIIEKIKGVKV